MEHAHFVHFMPAPEGPPHERRWLGLGVICTAIFIATIDMTIVNVALPDISNDLGAGIGELQWVLDAFLVTLAGLLLVGSGLADRFGRKRVFLAGLAGFGVTSVLSALAESPATLIGARALMGVAAACVMSPALSLLATIFPPEERPRAVGIWSAIGGLGLALGPVAGGVLVDAAGWRWVFLVSVPVVLVATLLGLRWLPESTRPGMPPLDVGGALLSTVGLGGIVLACIEGVDSGWTSPLVLGAAVAGVAASAGFVLLELRLPHPIFDVRVLARRRVACGAAVISGSYVVVMGLLFLLPQYVQYVQDRSALAAGFAIFPFGAVLGVAAARSARLEERLGAKATLAGGMLLTAAGIVPMLWLGPGSSPAWVMVGTGIVGLAAGSSVPPASALVMNDLGTDQAGDGAAVNQLARQVGGSLGVAIVGSVFAAVYGSHLRDRIEALSPEALASAEDSIEDARTVAEGLTGAERTRLLEQAIESFDVAARTGLLVCLGVAVATALVVWLGLRRA